MSLNSINTKLALLGEDGKFYAVIKMADESSTRSLETANSIPSLTQVNADKRTYRHWDVYYTRSQSFTITFSNSWA